MSTAPLLILQDEEESQVPFFARPPENRPPEDPGWILRVYKPVWYIYPGVYQRIDRSSKAPAGATILGILIPFVCCVYMMLWTYFFATCMFPLLFIGLLIEPREILSTVADYSRSRLWVAGTVVESCRRRCIGPPVILTLRYTCPEDGLIYETKIRKLVNRQKPQDEVKLLLLPGFPGSARTREEVDDVLVLCRLYHPSLWFIRWFLAFVVLVGHLMVTAFPTVLVVDGESTPQAIGYQMFLALQAWLFYRYGPPLFSLQTKHQILFRGRRVDDTDYPAPREEDLQLVESQVESSTLLPSSTAAS